MGFLSNLVRRFKAASDTLLGPDDAVFLTTLSGKRVPMREMYVPPPLPEGLPPVYGSAFHEGKWVVTVNGVKTSAPRWDTAEQARRDAWERHWADERGAKALAEYEAKRKL